MQIVPKLLAPLVSLWVPHAFVVSFKLETDESILITKARDSLNKYKHKVRDNICKLYYINVIFQCVIVASHRKYVANKEA